VERFSRFVEKTVEALREYTSLWCTINEPNVYTVSGYLLGLFPPGKQSLGAAFHVAGNMVKAHAAAYQVIHRLQPAARVGIAVNYRAFTPARSWSPLDRLAGGLQAAGFNHAFPNALQDGALRLAFLRQPIPQAKGTQDYIGVNYYTRDYVSFSLVHPTQLFGRRFYDPKAPLSDTGFMAHEPQGFFEALAWANRFRLPILVTENGVEDADDHLRPRYLAEHVHQMWRAVNFNYPIKGYFHWTLVDNFEWERGWTQRFGLWELDPETQGRRKRPSADLYAAICSENGLSTEMVAQYAPESLAVLFPD
jgi:beta-glucosidase